MKNTPIDLGISALGSQLVVLFGEVMEPLQGTALLKEVHHWRWALKFIAYLHFLFPFSAPGVRRMDGHVSH